MAIKTELSSQHLRNSEQGQVHHKTLAAEVAIVMPRASLLTSILNSSNSLTSGRDSPRPQPARGVRLEDATIPDLPHRQLIGDLDFEQY